MDRRDFIRSCGSAAAAGLTLGATGAAGAVLSGCAAPARAVVATLDGSDAIVPLSAFDDPSGGAPAPFVLVRVESLAKPVALYRSGAGAPGSAGPDSGLASPDTFTALLTVCTHRGCEVRPAPDHLSCPCHGSEFSPAGEVLNGPAELPLRQYPAAVEGSNIRIRL